MAALFLATAMFLVGIIGWGGLRAWARIGAWAWNASVRTPVRAGLTMELAVAIPFGPASVFFDDEPIADSSTEALEYYLEETAWRIDEAGYLVDGSVADSVRLGLVALTNTAFDSPKVGANICQSAGGSRYFAGPGAWAPSCHVVPAEHNSGKRKRARECMEQLGGPHCAGERCPILEAQDMLASHYHLTVQTSEDVAHSVMLRVCTLHGRNGVSDLRGYFFSSVKNEARDEYRRAGRTIPMDPHDGAFSRTWSVPSTPEQIAVRQVLSRMPQDYQDVLELSDMEGYTGPELARRLGIRPEAARKRLERARSEFARQWYHSR